MRYNKEIARLQREAHYHEACELLQDLLQKIIPRVSLLNTLYGSNKAAMIYKSIEKFFINNPHLFGVLRQHNDHAQEKISYTRSEIEKNNDYNSVQIQLLFDESPDVSHLQKFYGEFAEAILHVFNSYLHLHLERKCKITSTAHSNRVGAVVYGMQMDDDGSHVYSALGALHDAVEDLLMKIKIKSDIEYGLHRYDAFLHAFIPEELHELIKMLTNHYDLILEAITAGLESDDKALTVKNMQTEVEKLEAVTPKELQPYLEQMHYLLFYSVEEDEEFEEIKWKCYKDLYVDKMAKIASVSNNFRPFEIKAIDLSDNGHGRDSLPLASRLKNMIKHQVWVNSANDLNSTWHAVNDLRDELQEDVLVHAENLIIKDLLEPESTQDFIMSTMKKIVGLQSIFYVDMEP